MREQADEAGRIVGGGAYDSHTISTLKVGLYHLVILAIAERE